MKYLNFLKISLAIGRLFFRLFEFSRQKYKVSIVFYFHGKNISVNVEVGIYLNFPKITVAGVYFLHHLNFSAKNTKLELYFNFHVKNINFNVEVGMYLNFPKIPLAGVNLI